MKRAEVEACVGRVRSVRREKEERNEDIFGGREEVKGISTAFSVVSRSQLASAPLSITAYLIPARPL